MSFRTANREAEPVGRLPERRAPSAGRRRALPRAGARSAGLVVALWFGAMATAAMAQAGSDQVDRRHDNGLTTLRFHKGLFQYALVLDGAPRENAARHVVTADGRRIALRASGRSVWIDGAKFELPFGAVFLVTTKDSTRVRQLGFNAVRGRLMLDQAALATPVAEWLGEHGDPKGGVLRGAVEAATYPRHTLELTEWLYRGANAVTCVVSGAPLFVLLSRPPLDAGNSTQTFFGNLGSVEVHAGSGENRHTFRATASQATFFGRAYDLARGRVFLIPPAGGEARQVEAGLDLGVGTAQALADEIERVPEVRAFLRLE